MPQDLSKSLEIIRFTRKPDRVDAVFKSANGGHINCVLLPQNGEPYCSCENHNMNLPHPMCKHIDFTLSSLKYPFVTTGERNMTFVRTHLNCINDIFGGLPQSELFGLCGEPAIGKTRLLVTLAGSVMSITGKNAIWAGTEGAEVLNSIPWLMNQIKDRFDLDVGIKIYKVELREWLKERRAIRSDSKLAEHALSLPISLVEDTTTSDDQQKLVLISTPTLGHILSLLGVYSEKKHSKGGKSVLVPQPDWDNTQYVWDTPFGNLIEAENAEDGMFVVDSLTMLVDPNFVGAQQSFPGRSSTNMLICSRLDTTALEYEMFGIASHHLTRDPTNQWSKGKATGGKAVGHNFKYMGYMKKAGQKGYPQRRSLEGLRVGQHAAPSSVVKRFDLTDTGIEDVT